MQHLTFLLFGNNEVGQGNGLGYMTANMVTAYQPVYPGMLQNGFHSRIDTGQHYVYSFGL